MRQYVIPIYNWNMQKDRDKIIEVSKKISKFTFLYKIKIWDDLFYNKFIINPVNDYGDCDTIWITIKKNNMKLNRNIPDMFSNCNFSKNKFRRGTLYLYIDE